MYTAVRELKNMNINGIKTSDVTDQLIILYSCKMLHRSNMAYSNKTNPSP